MQSVGKNIICDLGRATNRAMGIFSRGLFYLLFSRLLLCLLIREALHAGHVARKNGYAYKVMFSKPYVKSERRIIVVCMIRK